MIYDKNGSSLTSAYDKDGTALTSAYDKNGTLVYTSTTETLKVMTYNVGQWYIGTSAKVPTAKKADYSAIHNHAFSTYQPDVLFLQEALSTWCDDGSLTSDLLAPYFDNTESSRTTTSYQGHYICTNGYPISNYEIHDFTSHGGNYPSFESCEITVGGKVITLINTHNDYSTVYQSSEVADLLNFVSDLDYFVLCGDFNIGLSVEDTTDSQYVNNVKAFLRAGYNVGNCVVGWIPTYFSTAEPTGGMFTDEIITSQNITISNLYADTTKLTDAISDKIDHIPLIAELVVTVVN